MKTKSIIFSLFLLILFHNSISAQSKGAYSGFLKRSGKTIVDGNSQNVVLRGMGLGGWMLQEGYMLHTTGFASVQYQIRNKITDLIGEDGTQKFYDAWLKNHCTSSDIDSLAKWGFNSVRLPFHYNLFTLPIEKEPVAGENTWQPKGFEMVDSLLKWCKKNKMYVILDMHAAPGGQGNDLAISDRDNTKPSLWDSPANQAKAIAVWVKLAEKYANETWIGGYDLLNETNWQMANNEPLKQFYLDLTSAIRKVDKKHLIFIEGNQFANDFTNLTPPWDENMAFSFHKYWNPNNQESIQWMIDIREKYNTPIWLGESGENSNHWFTDCIALMEKNNIGWSWWPLKKIGSVVDPATISFTKGYHDLLDYWNGKAPKPSAETAQTILMDLTEKLKIENCAINYDLIDALFRQPFTNATAAYANLKIPGKFFATQFDMGKNGYAYSDNSYHNISGIPTYGGNAGGVVRNDGVDIETNTDSLTYSNGFHLNEIEKNEWLKYSVNVKEKGLYNVALRVSNGSQKLGYLHFEQNGKHISRSVAIPIGKSDSDWKTVSLNSIKLESGEQPIILKFDCGGFNLSSLTWTGPTSVQKIPFTLLDARTDAKGKTFQLTFDDELDPKSISAGGLTFSTDKRTFKIKSLDLNKENQNQLIAEIDGNAFFNETIFFSCENSTISSLKGEKLFSLKKESVMNTANIFWEVEGKLKACDFTVNQGFVFEECEDTDKGRNAAYAKSGCYLEYFVKVNTPGKYFINYRYAGKEIDGDIELALNDGTLTALKTSKLPKTGNWQKWEYSKAEEIVLPAGFHTLRFTVIKGGFNLNFVEFKKAK